MGLREEYDFSRIRNETKRLVIEELERQLTDSNVCRCEDCILDIVTYSLNKLKPYYQVSLIGSLYVNAIETSDYSQQVKRVVREGMEKIKTNPAH